MRRKNELIEIDSKRKSMRNLLFSNFFFYKFIVGYIQIIIWKLKGCSTLNVPEEKAAEDTDVLNNLLSSLKTGIVKRQSMRRALPNDLGLSLAPIQIMSNEQSPPQLLEKKKPLDEKIQRPINPVKQMPVLVIPNGQTTTSATTLPLTPNTVKFRPICNCCIRNWVVFSLEIMLVIFNNRLKFWIFKYIKIF